MKSSFNSAFIKSETIWRELVSEGVIPQNGLKEVTSIKIMIEVDKEPPLGPSTEEKLFLKPFVLRKVPVSFRQKGRKDTGTAFSQLGQKCKGAGLV
ncbi:hypothetical protein [Daejeonella rubra]|uniref:hypothetical protein n=1 Tax=Daejeonella rubra TaxID=990371 RepID=UPI001FE1A0FF|nr:hypothetical protein [Daejeonella rubra]